MTLFRVFMFGPASRLFDEPGSVDIHVEPPTPDPVEEVEEVTDEIEDVSEQLALHSIISEERHNEILERVDECRNRLEQLSATESPSVAALQAEVQTLRSEMIELKSLLVSMSKNLQPRESTPEPVTELEEPKPGESTDEPKPEETETPEETAPKPPEPKKKNRFL